MFHLSTVRKNIDQLNFHFFIRCFPLKLVIVRISIQLQNCNKYNLSIVLFGVESKNTHFSIARPFTLSLYVYSLMVLLGRVSVSLPNSRCNFWKCSVISLSPYIYIHPSELFGCVPLGRIQDTCTIDEQYVPALSVLTVHLVSPTCVIVRARSACTLNSIANVLEGGWILNHPYYLVYFKLTH